MKLQHLCIVKVKVMAKGPGLTVKMLIVKRSTAKVKRLTVKRLNLKVKRLTAKVKRLIVKVKRLSAKLEPEPERLHKPLVRDDGR